MVPVQVIGKPELITVLVPAGHQEHPVIVIYHADYIALNNDEKRIHPNRINGSD